MTRSSYLLYNAVLVISYLSVCVEMDIYVPSFPDMVSLFHSTPEKIQAIISVNFLGLGIGSFLYGPLSDSFGRRIPILLGHLLFCVSSIGCLYVNSLNSLLIYRFIQGIGSAGPMTVMGTSIFDKFEQRKATQLLTLYGALITSGMVISPLLGNYLHILWGWKASFMLVACLSFIALIVVFFFFKETLSMTQRIPLHIGNILRAYGAFFISRAYVLRLFIFSLLFGIILMYLSNLSLIFIQYLHVSEHIYGLYQAVPMACFAIASFTCGWFIRAYGLSLAKKYGWVLAISGATLLQCAALIFPENPNSISAGIGLFSCGAAFLINLYYGESMNVFPDRKGIAGSLSAGLRLPITCIVIESTAHFFNGSILPIAIGASLCTYLAFMCYRQIETKNI